MSEQEPTGPYVYQPNRLGVERHAVRIFGVSGLPRGCVIEGLTREEAEAIVSALLSLEIKNQIKELVRSVPEALAAVDQSRLAAKVIELQLASDRARQEPNIIRGEQ